MSDINFSQILTDYPVAGQDNDSQGFRDNFTAIYNAFSVTKAEITDLQNTAVLKSNLDDNQPAENDLNGSVILDGFYNNFHGTSYSNEVSGPWPIDVRAGSLQNFEISNNIQFNFTQWPVTDRYAKVRIHISSASTEFAVTFTQSAGTIKYDGDFPSPLTITANQTPSVFHVVEAWTYTGGSVVFLKYLGIFSSTISNNKIFSGDLTVEGDAFVEGNTTVEGLISTSLNVSGASTLSSVSATSLSLSTNATINGTIEVRGNSTLGNDKTIDKVTFNSIPVFPSLTTVQRDALTSLTGMVIFNTTETQLQVCTVPGTGGTATWISLI